MAETNEVHTWKLEGTKYAEFGEQCDPPITTFGLKILKPREELDAAAKAKKNDLKAAYELAKSSLIEINGQAVDHAKGGIEKIWQGMHPKIRTLVTLAYGEIHSIDMDDAQDFLKSGTAKVG